MKILKYIIILNLFFFGISQITIGQNQRCTTIERTDEEMKEMPWYGNNKYLFNLVVGCNLKKNIFIIWNTYQKLVTLSKI